MPFYDFTFGDTPQSNTPHKQVFSGEHSPHMANTPINVPPIGIDKSDIADGDVNLDPDEIREVAVRGFYVLDEGMQNWLSGIRVPVNNTYKLANVHVVSYDRGVLTWAQDFFDGRVSLPVISIQRNSWNFDPTRFTPAYRPIFREFTDRTRKKMRLVYRPIPFKVDYTISIWSEFKSDAEYIMTDIITRTSPLGEFHVQDEFYQQIARVEHTGTTNNSDMDISKDRVKVVYDIALSVEYALPVSEKIVPTILGRVVSLKERDTGEVFDVYRAGDF